MKIEKSNRKIPKVRMIIIMIIKLELHKFCYLFCTIKSIIEL